MSSLRVGFTDPIFFLQQVGGVSRYFVELMKHLPSTGIPVEFLGRFHRNEYLAGLSEPKNQKVLDVPGSALSAKVYNRLHEMLAMAEDPPRIVHATYYPQPSRRLTYSKSKFVVTVFDMIHELFPDQFPAGDESAVLKRRAVEGADAIIAISHSTKRDLVRLCGVDPERVHVIHLASSLNSAPSLGAPSARPYILFVGTRAGYKNFDGLLTAYAASAVARECDLICFGGGAFSESERARIDTLKVSDKVRVVSGNDELLAAYYQTARLFVYPSKYEGFGLPPLEAMALGCPVACSNTSSLPEVVGDAALLFDPSRVEEIQAALEMSDRVRQDLIARGRVRAAEFTWSACAQQTAAVYRSL